MDVQTPVWVLLVGSAFGGGVVAALSAWLTWHLTFRHRHDETRRDAYVAMLAAVDEVHQALVDAVAANNRRFEHTSDVPEEQLALEVERAAHAVDDVVAKLAAARRAAATLILFAPASATEPLVLLMGQVWRNWTALERAWEEAVRWDAPELPGELWADFVEAARRDFRVRVETVPTSSGVVQGRLVS
jgi:hypothetical protein